MTLWEIRQAAEFLKLSTKTIYRWVGEGKIPYVKLGGRVLFDRSDLEEFVRGRKVKEK